MAASMRGCALRRLIACSLCKRERYTHRSRGPALEQLRNKTKEHGPISRPLESDVDVDTSVAEELDQGDMRHRSHAGKMCLKTVLVPARLENAAAVLTEKHRQAQIVRDVDRLNEQLSKRHPPQEEEQAVELLAQCLKKVRGSYRVNLEESTDVNEIEKHEKIIRQKALRKFKETSYKWKPLQYEGYGKLVYLVGRMAQNYSVILQILSEINKRESGYAPRTIYNYGSGIGSVIWAADEVWGKHVFNYYCVDPCGEMNELAQLLLQDGNPQKSSSVSRVYFRVFEPSDTKNKFEMVVSAYTLMEQPSKEERLKMVTSLWRRTQDYLVLVEYGTNAGYKLIAEARDYLLQLHTEGPDMEGYAYMPCSHDMECPKLQYQNMPCTFPVRYHPLIQTRGRGANAETERYSYIVMKKGPHPTDGTRWPRILQPTLPRPRHVHCHLCCPSGEFRQVIITKGKHSKNLYRCARMSDWGDVLPVDLGTDSREGRAVDWEDGQTTDSTGQDDTDTEDGLSSDLSYEGVGLADTEEFLETDSARKSQTDTENTLHSDSELPSDCDVVTKDMNIQDSLSDIDRTHGLSTKHSEEVLTDRSTVTENRQDGHKVK